MSKDWGCCAFLTVFQLPQLRALLAAVTADSSHAGRQANRKAVDAATMVLSMAGRVPDAELAASFQYSLQIGVNKQREGALQRS